MKKYPVFLFLVILVSVMLISISLYAVKHVVTVGSNNFPDFCFSPKNINVNVGDTMRWEWSHGQHTTTSDSISGGIPAGAAPWDHSINSGNQIFEYKVTVVGKYNYYCKVHNFHELMHYAHGSFTAAAGQTLTVTPSNRSVTASAGTTTFTVTSNASWTANSDAGWCSVNAGGTGNGTITATYSANTDVIRIATITVTVTGLVPQTVTVTQDGLLPTLTIDPENQNVGASSGNTTFSVLSNTTWTVASNASWCSVNPSGTRNGTITATFSANMTNVIRVAPITVMVTGLIPQTVTVTQAAESSVGYEKHALNNFQVYPNPSRGLVKVSVGKLSDKTVTIAIMDLDGKIVLSGVYSGSDEYSFDLSRTPGGYYFIKISTDSDTIVRRVVLID